jgi:hypothetical protein
VCRGADWLSGFNWGDISVDSELTCPVLVAPQMSASSASVLLWDCGQRVCVVHISTGRAAERI